MHLHNRTLRAPDGKLGSEVRRELTEERRLRAEAEKAVRHATMNSQLAAFFKIKA